MEVWICHQHPEDYNAPCGADTEEGVCNCDGNCPCQRADRPCVSDDSNSGEPTN